MNSRTPEKQARAFNFCLFKALPVSGAQPAMRVEMKRAESPYGWEGGIQHVPSLLAERPRGD